MKLKRIYAPSTKAGIDRITAQCGDNVMILSNRREDDQNVILVAFDEGSAPQVSAEKPAKANFGSILDSRNSHLRDQLIKQAPVKPAVSSMPASKAPAARPVESTGAENIDRAEERVMQSLATQIREELMSLKHEIVSLKNDRNSKASDNREHELIGKLYETGASAPLIQECRNLLVAEEDSAAVTVLLADHVRKLGITGELLTGGTHMLIGSHGSGKTTMAVKLAQHLQTPDMPAIVISYKDKKEGAWSVLRLLCARAGITAYQAQTIESLMAVVEEYGDRASIVIDTCSATPEATLTEIRASIKDARFHAVLPADTYLGSLRSLGGNEFAEFDSALLTRMDHDVQPWPIVKLLQANRIRISLGCTSPDPEVKLLEVTPDLLAEKLQPSEPHLPSIPVHGDSFGKEFAFQLC